MVHEVYLSMLKLGNFPPTNRNSLQGRIHSDDSLLNQRRDIRPVKLVVINEPINIIPYTSHTSEEIKSVHIKQKKARVAFPVDYVTDNT